MSDNGGIRLWVMSDNRCITVKTGYLIIISRIWVQLTMGDLLLVLMEIEGVLVGYFR